MFTTDRVYLASCKRFGIAPSAFDYDDYRSEAAMDEPDTCGDDAHADGRGGDIEFN